MEIILRNAVYLLLVYASFATVLDATSCGVKDYDVSSLHGRPDWFFNVQDAKDCVEPNSTCRIYFTVCQSLSLSGNCSGNSGICEVIYPNGKNKIHRYFSLGTVTNYFNDKDQDGFITVYTNSTDTTAACPNGPITVLLTFTCDMNAKWNFTSGDVTEHVVNVDVRDPCETILNIKYSGACIKEKADIIGCNALEHYNLISLRKRSLWIADVPENLCKNPFVTSNYGAISDGRGESVSDDDLCVLMFSFCEPLDSINCANSIFCQADALGKAISFGSYDTQFRVDGNADYTGFTISAYEGTKTRNCSGGFYSTLVFNCSEDANWDSVSNSNIGKYVTAMPNEDECEFIVILQYSGACTNYRPSSKSKESPFGGIIIGIFFGVLILYFIIGAIVQYARGRRGPDIVPNNEFWTTFFILALEGCRYSLDVVTCFQLKSSGGKIASEYEKL